MAETTSPVESGSDPASAPTKTDPPKGGPPAANTPSDTLPPVVIPVRPDAPPDIPGYKIELALGIAAIGRTYRAVPYSGGPPVILKVLDEKIVSDPVLRDRIVDAIDRYAKVDHPHIIKVVGKGNTAGKPWYAIEMVPSSTTLLDLVRRARPLDAAELAWVARALGRALIALHDAGIAHGDLTPVNIAVAPGGVIKIVDLGWAPRIRDTLGGGPSASRSASQRYAQQLISQAVERGERADAGKIAEDFLRRSDVAALGATLTYSTTGQPARQGGPGLVERAPWLPPGLSKLIDDMRGDVKTRPSAKEAVERLQPLLAECGVTGENAPPSLDEALSTLVASREQPVTTEPGSPRSQGGGGAPSLGKFGRYVLLEEIARGGMGAVFRAKHAELDRVFALKVMLSSDVVSEQARARFLREAEAAVRLDHPGIVRVHDFGEVEGRVYMAMDLAPGSPLNELYQKKEIDLARDILPIVVKCADAVHYAHSRGIIHRDLKPANVVVDMQGQPRILDFGVAKRIDAPHEAGQGAAGVTTAGELVGTPAYMSPEQAEGRTNDVDTRSDVYSIGVILYEAASRGRLPFEGANVTDVLTKILLDDPVPPSKHRAEVPWEIDAIVLKAIEKDPAKRYQSAAELRDDLQRLLEGRPINARAVGVGYRAKKWLVRNRLPFGIGAAATVILLFFFIRYEMAIAEAARNRAQQVERWVKEGTKHLGEGDGDKARDAFGAALALEPDSPEATRGKRAAETMLEMKRAEIERELERNRARQRARLRVAEGQKLLDAQKGEDARVAFGQALADDPENEAARVGLEKAAGLAAVVDRIKRDQENKERARQLAGEGKRALADGRAEDAKRAFVQALGFDGQNVEARDGLAEAQRLTAEEQARKEAEQRELDRRARNKADAAGYVEKARAVLGEGKLEQARDIAIQALAFDGTNKDATELLAECARRIESRRRDELNVLRRAEAKQSLEQARAAVERAHQLVRDGADRADIRSGYFEALRAYERVLTIAPDEQDPRKERARAALELGRLARAAGDYGLAEYCTVMAGNDAGVEDSSFEFEDKFLRVNEVDRELIRRAFNEPVEFERCESAFAKMRERVSVPQNGRFLIEVRIRSSVDEKKNVFFVALELQVHDTQKNVTTAAERVPMEGGPWQRVVVVGATGRQIRSFERALRLDGSARDAAIERIEAMAREHITKLQREDRRP